MSKNTLPEFTPELRVIAPGTASNRLMVVFDTSTDLDLKRSPRVVIVDTEGVTNFWTEVTDIATEERVVRALYRGQINLLTKKGEAAPVTYLLADFELEVDAVGKPDKSGKSAFPPVLEIEQLVRQGVADAFTRSRCEFRSKTPPGSGTSNPNKQLGDWQARLASSFRWQGTHRDSRSNQAGRWTGRIQGREGRPRRHPLRHHRPALPLLPQRVPQNP